MPSFPSLTYLVKNPAVIIITPIIGKRPRSARRCLVSSLYTILSPHSRNHQIAPAHAVLRLEFNGSEARGPDGAFAIRQWIKYVSFNMDDGLCIQ